MHYRISRLRATVRSRCARARVYLRPLARNGVRFRSFPLPPPSPPRSPRGCIPHCRGRGKLQKIPGEILFEVYSSTADRRRGSNPPSWLARSAGGITIILLPPLPPLMRRCVIRCDIRSGALKQRAFPQAGAFLRVLGANRISRHVKGKLRTTPRPRADPGRY